MKKRVETTDLYFRQSRFQPRIWDSLRDARFRPDKSKKWYAYDHKMNDFLYGVKGMTKTECIMAIEKGLMEGTLKYEPCDKERRVANVDLRS